MPEEKAPKVSAPDIKISHSIKTNAYKMRDSIRCAHDIDDDMMDKNGYLVMMCDGIQGDEDTPSYITKRIMDEFYSNKRENESIQDFFENTIDKLDAEIVKFVSSGKSGTSLLACVIKNRELYLIGVGSARLYHIRADHAKLLTSEHRYKLDLANKVRVGEMTELEAKNDPRREELVSYIGVGGINYIDMNDVPIMLHDDDLLLFCSDGLYQSLDDEDIMDIVNNYEGEFKDCAKALTTAAMENVDSSKDNDISALIIKIGE
jgi:protein phosphatase